MLTLAWAAFGLSFLTYGLALAPFLMVLFLTGIALGIAGAAGRCSEALGPPPNG